MAGTGSRWRLGLIGLGRSWETQHKPGLAASGARFEAAALFDQVARRAELESSSLRCRAIHGLKTLIESPDVDALAWLAPQWFGTQAIALAAAADKPIACLVPWPTDPTEIGRIDQILTSLPDRARIFWPGEVNLADALPQFAALIQGDGPTPARWLGPAQAPDRDTSPPPIGPGS